MNVRQGYFQFLLNKVHEEAGQNVGLCWLMYNTDFFHYPVIYSDASRASDGTELRYEYAVYCGEGVNNVASDEALGELYDMPCTVLEMLVALAIRIDRDITGDPGVDGAYLWFQLMLSNLGLYNNPDELSWGPILKTFMLREYDFGGHGGLFPLSAPYRDQRTIGIWDQLSDYISEMRERGMLC